MTDEEVDAVARAMAKADGVSWNALPSSMLSEIKLFGQNYHLVSGTAIYIQRARAAIHALDTMRRKSE